MAKEDESYLARKLRPAISEAAQTVKQGLYRSRGDFLLGAIAGFTVLMAIQSIPVIKKKQDKVSTFVILGIGIGAYLINEKSIKKLEMYNGS